MPVQLSRPKRWAAALDAVRTSLERVVEEASSLTAAFEDLRSVQEEYEAWKENMSENLQGSAAYEKLEAICDLDFNVELDLTEIEEVLEAAENADLPLGFGRD